MDRKGSDASARKLVNEVAAELARLDWSGKLKMADDFTVFAVDFECGDLLKNLKQSVPPGQLAKFRAQKLI